jgi:adenosylhomocysteine nucleosidase
MRAVVTQTLVIVVGLPFEARLAKRICAQVICSGDGQRLAASLTHAITKQCQGLISLGVAGGLLPNLSAGTCVIGSQILDGAQRLMTDRSWSQSLLQAIPGSIYGKIVGVAAPIAFPEMKHSLYVKTGAMAVDMESHVVGNVAVTNALPFVVIRVISDPAERSLPQLALAAMRPNGTVNIAAMALSLMKHPREVRALLETARDTFAARIMLSRACSVLRSCSEPDVRSPTVTLKCEAMASLKTVTGHLGPRTEFVRNSRE